MSAEAERLRRYAEFMAPFVDLYGGVQAINSAYFEWQGREDGDDR